MVPPREFDDAPEMVNRRHPERRKARRTLRGSNKTPLRPSSVEGKPTTISSGCFQLRVLDLGFSCDGGSVSARVWEILRRLPVKCVDLLVADVADD